MVVTAFADPEIDRTENPLQTTVASIVDQKVQPTGAAQPATDPSVMAVAISAELTNELRKWWVSGLGEANRSHESLCIIV